MAEKGARARLEAVARQLYVDSGNLTYVAETLDISRQTLTEWKARTRRAGDELDEWDKARKAKEGYEADLVEIRDKIMEAVKSSPLTAAAHLDSLSKIEAILEKRAKQAREAADAISRQKGEMFLAVVKDLIEHARTSGNQDLLNALQDSFDEIVQFGRERYAAA